jgi:hypothetical protein
MSEPKDPADEAKERFNNQVAVVVAVAATFLAVCNVKDSNINQAMDRAQAGANDAWAYFQAKSTKQQVAEGVVAELESQLAIARDDDQKAQLSEHIAAWKVKAAKYESDKADVEKQARAAKADYDALNFRDDQFDMSEAALSLAIALMGIASLVQKRWLLGLGVAFSLFGFVLGVAGFAGWNIHPDTLANWLS